MRTIISIPNNVKWTENAIFDRRLLNSSPVTHWVSHKGEKAVPIPIIQPPTLSEFDLAWLSGAFGKLVQLCGKDPRDFVIQPRKSKSGRPKKWESCEERAAIVHVLVANNASFNQIGSMTESLSRRTMEGPSKRSAERLLIETTLAWLMEKAERISKASNCFLMTDGSGTVTKKRSLECFVVGGFVGANRVEMSPFLLVEAVSATAPDLLKQTLEAVDMISKLQRILQIPDELRFTLAKLRTMNVDNTGVNTGSQGGLGVLLNKALQEEMRREYGATALAKPVVLIGCIDHIASLVLRLFESSVSKYFKTLDMQFLMSKDACSPFQIALRVYRLVSGGEAGVSFQTFCHDHKKAIMSTEAIVRGRYISWGILASRVLDYLPSILMWAAGNFNLLSQQERSDITWLCHWDVQSVLWVAAYLTKQHLKPLMKLAGHTHKVEEIQDRLRKNLEWCSQGYNQVRACFQVWKHTYMQSDPCRTDRPTCERVIGLIGKVGLQEALRLLQTVPDRLVSYKITHKSIDGFSLMQGEKPIAATREAAETDSAGEATHTEAGSYDMDIDVRDGLDIDQIHMERPIGQGVAPSLQDSRDDNANHVAALERRDAYGRLGMESLETMVNRHCLGVLQMEGGLIMGTSRFVESTFGVAKRKMESNGCIGALLLFCIIVLRSVSEEDMRKALEKYSAKWDLRRIATQLDKERVRWMEVQKEISANREVERRKEDLRVAKNEMNSKVADLIRSVDENFGEKKAPTKKDIASIMKAHRADNERVPDLPKEQMVNQITTMSFFRSRYPIICAELKKCLIRIESVSEEIASAPNVKKRQAEAPTENSTEESRPKRLKG